jgi:hypothetical protein
VPTATREVYMIFLEHFDRNVAAAIRAIANAPEGGSSSTAPGARTAPGCSQPPLHVAGVGHRRDRGDYALSEERCAHGTSSGSRRPRARRSCERMKRMSQTPAESIKGVFEELERRYGSVEGYLPTPA